MGSLHLGIDARMWEPGPLVGISRYLDELLRGLENDEGEETLAVFVRCARFETWRPKNSRILPRLADIPWYGLAEQWKMAHLMDREHLDLLHIPHWNVPLLLRTPFVMTVHDLLLLDQPFSANATTRSKPLHLLKYVLWRLCLRRNLRRARAILVPTAYVAERLRRHAPSIPTSRIHVIPLGVSSLPHPLADEAQTRLPPSSLPFYLFVGSAFPHKNLERLLRAYAHVLRSRSELPDLVLAGRSSIFLERLKAQIPPWMLSRVHVIENPTDEEIATLYHHARAFVFPSLEEGFGLPPLEAMSFGVPVISSKASCLPEVLGDAALLFDPTSEADLEQALIRIHTDEPLRQDLIRKGKERVRYFSWERMVKETKKVYHSVEESLF